MDEVIYGFVELPAGETASFRIVAQHDFMQGLFVDLHHQRILCRHPNISEGCEVFVLKHDFKAFVIAHARDGPVLYLDTSQSSFRITKILEIEKAEDWVAKVNASLKKSV